MGTEACDECNGQLGFKYIRVIVFDDLANERVFCSYKCMFEYNTLSLLDEICQLPLPNEGVSLEANKDDRKIKDVNRS